MRVHQLAPGQDLHAPEDGLKPVTGRIACENVLDGLSERQAQLAVMANFNIERAKRWDQTLLADVLLNGINALRVRRNGRKR
jgi:hypothetical protein